MMKRTYCITAALLSMALTVAAQTLNVKVGSVDYQFPASMTGQMTYTAGGTALNVMGHTFQLSEVGSMSVNSTATPTNAVLAAYGADGLTLTIASEQQANLNANYLGLSNSPLCQNAFGGIRLNFSLTGITHVEIESVDGYNLATGHSIMTIKAPDGEALEPGKDYYVATLPCDVSSGYRLSIYKDGLEAQYFGVHQVIEAGQFIHPDDLRESDLEFDDPDAPLVEEERPGLDKDTKDALVAYQKNPTEENKQALLDQMGTKYDKVVARKKAKLRELERDAKQQMLVDEMQAIVDEMVNNRDIRLQQQFLRLIDPREDDDLTDQWLVLRGSSAPNAYVGYAPVTNIEYAAYDHNFSYAEGQDSLPVVNVTYAQAQAYCNYLSGNDSKHSYRLPTEEEWILAAGHMPKDVKMNSDHVEAGLTSVNLYAQTVGACGGIDFWGNCWEWTSTANDAGLLIVKGGSWDSSRDACRSEYSDDARDASKGYGNVGFRVVRVDR